MRNSGIEPKSCPWQGHVFPLDQSRAVISQGNHQPTRSPFEPRENGGCRKSYGQSRHLPSSTLDKASLKLAQASDIPSRRSRERLTLSTQFYNLSSNGVSLARFIRVRLPCIVSAERIVYTRALSGQTGVTWTRSVEVRVSDLHQHLKPSQGSILG